MSPAWLARGPVAAVRLGLWLACVVLAGSFLLVFAAPAQAHAVPVSSSPQPGATLGAAPGTVVLTFDEPLVRRLSHASVVDPAGRRFGGSVLRETMRVRLASNSPGIYRVEWTTVSQVDGHTVTGAYQFGVGVPAGAPGGHTTTPGPSPGDVAVGAARTIEYAIVLLACGLAVLRWLGRDLPWQVPAVPVATALLVSGTAVVLAEAALATSGLSVAGLADYLSIGVTGWARIARIGLEAGLLITAVTAGRLPALLLAAVIGTVAIAGHGATTDPAWAGLAVNAAHLAAAGVWAGGIMALALIRVTGRWASVGRPVLPRFSKVAPWAFAASVGLGALQAAQLLGGPGEVLGTGYGLTLMAKAIVIIVAIPLSLLAWRRVRVMVRSEAVLALVVVMAAAALAAFPVVPREAHEAAESREAGGAAAHVSPFPRRGDLTIAGRAGRNTLVGLTVRPGRPGRNQVFAYLSPSPPGPGSVRLSAGGTWSAFTPCGGACWRATARLRGGERLVVAVAGDRGGTATFTLPPLPPPDGAELAGRATRRMDRLRRYRVDEVLSGIRSAYAYARPHAMWQRTWLAAGPYDTVWIGSSLYRRSSPDAPWKLKSKGVLAPVPYFVWKPFKPFANPAVIGTARVGDAGVTLVSLFGGHGPDPEPVWFTLWVDRATGLVLRSQMWAPNHFMDDRYLAFDQPVTIPRPGSG